MRVFCQSLIKLLPPTEFINNYITHGLFEIIGKLFIEAMKMLVVPIVFVSLVCGTFNFKSGKNFARIGVKTIALYLITTAIAIALGLLFASLFKIGAGKQNLLAFTANLHIEAPQTIKQMIISLIPANPIKAMAEGNMLQIIVFSLLVGLAINLCGKRADNVAKFFNSANDILMNLIHLVMHLAPIGVFCLLANVFAKLGFAIERYFVCKNQLQYLEKPLKF